MCDLAATIARRIRREGPLSTAAFMAMALHDPDCGYYASRNPLGAAGDFVTAPEISQIFGELLGAWCADLWQRLGRPDPVILAELGPGSGALAEDMLRATRRVPGLHAALRLYLVETSALLRHRQRRRLAQAAPRFVAGFDELPAGPLLLVANEFLDALPIRQLVRGKAQWRERLVAVGLHGRLMFVEGAESAALTLLVPPAQRAAAPGTVIEICPAAAALAAALGERLARDTGAALFVDYGYVARPPGATLAAVRGHLPAAVLDAPGSADLSAHVDFAAFAAAAEAGGAAVHGPLAQGLFLARLGAATRLAALSRAAAPKQQEALASGLRRLIDPGQMGTLFQALAMTSPGFGPPAGFAADEDGSGR